MNIAICGNYDVTKKKVGGQSDRTQIIIDEIDKASKHHLHVMNFFTYRKNMIKVLYNAAKLYFSNDVIIYICSLRGNFTFTILFSLLNMIKKNKLFCVVIGAPNIQRMKKNSIFFTLFKKLDGSFFEIEELANKMREEGCKNTYFFPNAKSIRNNSEIDKTNFVEPYRVCTYSRVVKEKGIIDAIYAVKSVNKRLGKKIYVLDIYGQISPDFEKEFRQHVDNSTVHFLGTIPREKSKEYLQKYFLFLFPTHHKGEGVPGGIIDAFEAGVPIITTDVSYNSYLIKSGTTGEVYEETNENKLAEILLNAAERPDEYTAMRENCLKEAMKYDLDNVMKRFLQIIET